MKGYRAVGAGVLLVACLGIGAAGGLDAAGNVDQFYVTPHLHAERSSSVVASAAADGNESPPRPTSLPAGGAVWIGGGSPDLSGDGSDLTEIDRVVEQAAAVRVHRGRRAPHPPINGVALEPLTATDPTPPTT